MARTIFAAEAVGVARECTEQAAQYAKEREQFGRPIAMFQAVKHHCANMLVATELATAAVWDAARAASAGGDQFSLTAAMAAALAMPAADLCANLNTQVHGGIAFTWEHDAHLYMRRAAALGAIVDADEAAGQRPTSPGPASGAPIGRPAAGGGARSATRSAPFADSIAGLDKAAAAGAARRDGLRDAALAGAVGSRRGRRRTTRHPAGVRARRHRAAGTKDHGVGHPHAHPARHRRSGRPLGAPGPQPGRHLVPAVQRARCGLRRRRHQDPGTRVDGGWLVNGQKVWTSQAHVAKRGLATVRTNPDAPKHNGITMMVIDMEAAGVEVRPLKMVTGNSDFNEVFFNDVFVPDDDVVGPVDGGWTVARATLGNESVSIGGGSGAMTMAGDALIPLLDAHPERLAGGPSRIGRYIADHQAIAVLNLRSAHRAVAGGEPGPEGNVTKLVLSEIGHEAAAIAAELAGPDGAFMDGQAGMAGCSSSATAGCRSPAVHRRSSATRSASASSASHVIPCEVARLPNLGAIRSLGAIRLGFRDNPRPERRTAHTREAAAWQGTPSCPKGRTC